VIDTARLRTAASRFRQSVASQVSGTLAYTAVCLVMLLYAVLLEKMPDIALARISRLLDWLG
jgi:MFS superfamily sulfate permease-like transporter